MKTITDRKAWTIAACWLVSAATPAWAGNAPEGAQRSAEEDYLPKVVQACGAPLTIRYEAESLKKNNKDIGFDQTGGSRECDEPLRYLYYSCQTPEGRAAVKAARVSQLVCKGVAGRVGSLGLSGGVMTVERAFEEAAPFARSAAQCRAVREARRHAARARQRRSVLRPALE